MNTLLIATDFSDASRNASRYGVELAKQINAKIILVHVYPNAPTGEAALLVSDQELEDNAEQRLAEEKTWLTQKYSVQIKTISRQGKPWEQVIALANKIDSNWIVAGMKGGSRMARIMFGGTSFMLSRHSGCPVLLIPQNACFSIPTTIALASDITDAALIDVLNPLTTFAETFDAEMYVIRVITKGMCEVLERVMTPAMFKWKFKNLQTSYDFPNANDVAYAINAFVFEHQVDIVVMVCQEHNLVERIFSKSNIREMILHTTVPLMILPGKVDSVHPHRMGITHHMDNELRLQF